MRILVIGLDAATMDLIEPWAAVGHLPALSRLMTEGSSGRLLSTPNMHSASAWTSILTGLNPGRHGLYVFSDRDFASGEQVFFKGGDRAGQLISAYLFSQGLTAGFLNVPMTYPAEAGAGGFMISGLDAPSLNDRAFAPTGLRAEVLGRFPRYRFSPEGLGDLMRAGQLEQAANAWLSLVEIQTDVAEYLTDEHPVDFFMTVFTASDWAGHNLWVHADDSDSNPLLGVYRALDAAVRRLLEHAGGSTQVYVISDHGMGRHTGASYRLAEWLEGRGYMIRRSRRRASVAGAARRAASNLLPVSVKERLKAGLGDGVTRRLRSAEKSSFYSSIDWEHTSAYSEPGRHVININLRGRNAGGIVEPDDYERVCSRLKTDLGEWTDSRGTKVVASVIRRDDVYSGPFTGRASDLYVEWNPAATLGEPPEEVRSRGFWWSGDHRPEGVLICKGPGIRRGHMTQAPRVYDLVPTILYGAGLTVPGELDGRVIQDAFTEEFRAANELRIGASGGGRKAAGSALTADEERMVEDKLRSLGYL